VRPSTAAEARAVLSSLPSVAARSWTSRWWAYWPTWVGYATAAWSLAYGALGLYWWAGGAGFPFAPIDLAHVSGSILEGSRAEVVAPFMAGLGLLGAGTALVMARQPRRSRATTAMLVFGWTVAAALMLVVPDYFLIALVAFAPLLVVFAFTGVPGDQDGLGDILYWHRTNLLILFVGGVLWAGATLACHRRVRDACVHCGRREDGAGPRLSRDALLRWGRWAVLLACVAPLPYEITRVAWFLGFPLGITPEFLAMMQGTPGMLTIGLGCAIASMVGGVLTRGLVRGWGEVYPRWLWFRAGGRVPPALAVVPASVVAVLLIPAGLMNFRGSITRDTWALYVPSTFWLVWGVALGAATLAYHLRRRTACRRCGRGDHAARPVTDAGRGTGGGAPGRPG
jgi:hypothetical protein